MNSFKVVSIYTWVWEKNYIFAGLKVYFKGNILHIFFKNIWKMILRSLHFNFQKIFDTEDSWKSLLNDCYEPYVSTTLTCQTCHKCPTYQIIFVCHTYPMCPLRILWLIKGILSFLRVKKTLTCHTCLTCNTC